ncbi:Uncharacterised protein [Mycobacteroides abscessus subsp. massiliense]|nr:Uncharacterised protein [Mycobacteroides abscessus subsp. massiliense]
MHPVLGRGHDPGLMVAAERDLDVDRSGAGRTRATTQHPRPGRSGDGGGDSCRAQQLAAIEPRAHAGLSARTPLTVRR